MKIVMNQNICYISEKESSIRCCAKHFNSNMKPCIGDVIELPAFNHQTQFSKVKEIFINFEKGECNIIVEQLITNKLTDMQEYIQVLIDHGWVEEFVE
ncbi:hypothetical protein [Bacillus sp. C1]